MSFDHQYYANHIDEWCEDSEWIELRTLDQLIKVLDISKLNQEQFLSFFDIVSFFFGKRYKIKMLEHTHLDKVNDLPSIMSILKFLGEFLCFPFYSELLRAVNTIIQGYDSRITQLQAELRTKDKIIRNYENFIPEKTETSEQNTNALKNLKKITKNYHQIYYILEKAVKERDLYTIKYSVDEGYYDVRDNTFAFDMIFRASKENNLKLVKLFHIYGANLKIRNNRNETILHNFSKNGNVEGVKFSLRFVDVNERNCNGQTPLHWAALSNNPHVCEYLLQQPNIDKSPKDYYEDTPLSFADRFEKYRSREVLTRYGCTK
ncbi:hypothetical protein TVAG_152240 [Trichomonas vaginalis G3]|uniref:Uncharacterized protein n=1 Tax=Trichomonas vaginalis (strain ATCC PRA-98 / G3) TaxID=412133 RepID=A2F700_TRIV3|nr:protein ubiquitination [Trichomonas vaginalis G3]EAX99305.1 hypothetical protein TVAG_152240 [Trichomonas vaginalis G3]KAI5500135.1 protein ubiquitination [Trichomonas vaginalis G3]|eukprot:XP_001312235.1 hypothetical protein [Trichomonas vaginalis G3]